VSGQCQGVVETWTVCPDRDSTWASGRGWAVDTDNCLQLAGSRLLCGQSPYSDTDSDRRGMTSRDNPVDQTFIDADQDRTRLADQMIATDTDRIPLEGYERLLTVNIPIDWSRSKLETDDVQYDPWRGDPGEHEIIKSDLLPDGEIEQVENPSEKKIRELSDDMLYRLLFRLPSLSGPEICGTTRQLIDVDTPLYNRLWSDVDEVEKDKIQEMTRLLDAHEREPTTRGSHAQTLLKLDTQALSTMQLTRAKLSCVAEPRPFQRMPRRPKVFIELLAIFAERSSGALSAHRRLNHYRRQLNTDAYDLPLDILHHLTEKHDLADSVIWSLLAPGRHADRPGLWLACALRDLNANGGCSPEQIADQCCYYDLTTHIPPDRDTLKRHANNIREHVLADPAQKLLHTTMETITLDLDGLTKQWWVRDPPAVFPPYFLRILLSFQDLLRETSGDKLVPSTLPDGECTRNRTPVAGYQFQFDDSVDGNRHPLRLAMDVNKDISPMELERLYRVPDIDMFRERGNYIKYLEQTGSQYVRHSDDFRDKEHFRKWLVGKPESDSSPEAILNYYL
jgi:hypothetical protein